jgi:hypothetical protein
MSRKSIRVLLFACIALACATVGPRSTDSTLTLERTH